jgi:glycosyltransferase involved in cell wall biosynthesis
MSLKVGLFHSTLPSGGRKLGGVEVLVHRLANALVNAGHQVKVWTLTSSPSDALYQVVPLAPESLLRSKLRRLTQVPVLLQMASFDDIDILHLHGDDWFYIYRNLPTIRTLHGSALYESRYATSFKRRLAQGLIFPAEVLSSWLASATFSDGPGIPRVYRADGLLTPGFDTSSVHTERSERPAVLFVGTWNGRKRGRWLAEQFRLVLSQVPDAELWLVSDEAADLQNVVCFNNPSDDELRKLYARAWVFCLPSTYEGFGMPYVESMLQSTPVVSTPNPGANYLLRNGGGLVVPDQEVASAIVALLSSEDTRAVLGAEARAVATDFGWEAAVKAHGRAYELAISRWHSSRRNPIRHLGGALGRRWRY